MTHGVIVTCGTANTISLSHSHVAQHHLDTRQMLNFLTEIKNKLKIKKNQKFKI